jgi:hypothetical protein
VFLDRFRSKGRFRLTSNLQDGFWRANDFKGQGGAGGQKALKAKKLRRGKRFFNKQKKKLPLLRELFFE